MRKFFYVLGIVAAVAIIAGGASLFWLIRTGSALDTESRAYVDDAVIAISAHWSKDELLKRATPQLSQQLNARPQQLNDLFDGASAGLGPLRQYEGAQGEAFINATTASGTIISAHYLAKVQYQKGDAMLRIALLQIDGQWRIHGFYIDSTAMISNLAGKRS